MFKNCPPEFRKHYHHHSFIPFLYLLIHTLGRRGLLESIPAVKERKAGYSLDRRLGTNKTEGSRLALLEADQLNMGLHVSEAKPI